MSLTCILCKQTEYLIASQIMKHLNTNNLLYDKQHGLRSKLSCETQLLEFSANILKMLQDRKQYDTIIMDFSKAFNKISHDHLLYKLNHAGIDHLTRIWFSSFLSNQFQRVRNLNTGQDALKTFSNMQREVTKKTNSLVFRYPIRKCLITTIQLTTLVKIPIKGTTLFQV